MYERTAEEQHQAVSSMLSSPVELPCSSHLVPSDPQHSNTVSLPHICPPVLYHVFYHSLGGTFQLPTHWATMQT